MYCLLFFLMITASESFLKGMNEKDLISEKQVREYEPGDKKDVTHIAKENLAALVTINRFSSEEEAFQENIGWLLDTLEKESINIKMKVVTNNNKAKGFITYHVQNKTKWLPLLIGKHATKKVLRIEHLAVSKSDQGHGYGAFLMNTIIKEAQEELDADTIELDVDNFSAYSSTTPTRLFYKKFGIVGPTTSPRLSSSTVTLKKTIKPGCLNVFFNKKIKPFVSKVLK